MLENVQPAELVAGLLGVIAFFFPGYGVTLMNKVKEWFGATGRAANAIILIFLGAVSFVALLVTGYFAGFQVTADNLFVVWGILYAMSQDAYKRIYPPA